MAKTIDLGAILKEAKAGAGEITDDIAKEAMREAVITALGLAAREAEVHTVVFDDDMIDGVVWDGEYTLVNQNSITRIIERIK